MKIDSYLDKLGMSVAVSSHDGTVVSEHKALVIPLRYKNKMYLSGIYTDIGFNSEGHYLYIGPPCCDLTALEEGVTITAHSTDYRIDRAERVYKGDDVLYVWAVIRVIVKEEQYERNKCPAR